jgi:hypothetical protein
MTDEYERGAMMESKGKGKPEIEKNLSRCHSTTNPTQTAIA